MPDLREGPGRDGLPLVRLVLVAGRAIRPEPVADGQVPLPVRDFQSLANVVIADTEVLDGGGRTDHRLHTKPSGTMSSRFSADRRTPASGEASNREIAIPRTLFEPRER